MSKHAWTVAGNVTLTTGLESLTCVFCFAPADIECLIGLFEELGIGVTFLMHCSRRLLHCINRQPQDFSPVFQPTSGEQCKTP